MVTKIHNLPPIVFRLNELSEIKSFDSALIVALTPDFEFVVIQELNTPEIWRQFWRNANDAKDLNDIRIIQSRPVSTEVSDLKKRIIRALRIIINKGYLFFGILYLGSNVFDENIIQEGSLFKKQIKEFIDMQKKYRRMNIYPAVKRDGIKSQFIGVGEKYFSFENIQFTQAAKMSQFFRGSFHGIGGVLDECLSFAILSQNITKNAELGPQLIDKKGRDNLKYLIKMQKFNPGFGFKFDFGFDALKFHPKFGAMEMLPDFQKDMQNYQKYFTAIIEEQPNPFELQSDLDIFAKDVELKLKNTAPQDSSEKRSMMSEILGSIEQKQSNVTDKILEGIKQPSIPKPSPFIPSQATAGLPKISQPSSSTSSIKPDLQKPSLSSPQMPGVSPLQKPSVSPLQKPSVSPLQKPTVSSLQKPSINSSASSIPKTPAADRNSSDEYEDVFSATKELSPEELEAKMIREAEFMLNEDEVRPLNMDIMSQTDIFRDLEMSLEAMSQLDEMASKDQAVSRIYYPPPTLISFANKEGMEIGGSTVFLSMGTGRNLYMVPELKRMQMWGQFYKDVEGNPQIEDFVAMEEKDIESPQEFEDILQKSFINLRKNNQVYLGIMEIEGNGFEKNVFEEIELEWTDIEKLMQIHIERRASIKYPEINRENWIEIRYFGKQKDLLANNARQGILEVTEDIITNEVFSKGLMGGIVCVDEEAVYFFILADNFSNLDNPPEKLEIDHETLDKMYELISKSNLSPVSWWKLKFGFNGLDMLFVWEDIKDGVIVNMVKENYQKYLDKSMETKHKEDAIRQQAEFQFPKINKDEE
jgi:hypothetical protein